MTEIPAHLAARLPEDHPDHPDNNQPLPKVDDLHEAAWGLIANAGGGDWTRETDEWRGAAIRWRDQYHERLPSLADLATPRFADGTGDEAPAPTDTNDDYRPPSIADGTVAEGLIRGLQLLIDEYGAAGVSATLQEMVNGRVPQGVPLDPSDLDGYPHAPPDPRLMRTDIELLNALTAQAAQLAAMADMIDVLIAYALGRTEEAEMFYVLVCLHCSPGIDPERPDWAVIPFDSPEERGKWAAEHTARTGHDQWVVLDQVRGP